LKKKKQWKKFYFYSFEPFLDIINWWTVCRISGGTEIKWNNNGVDVVRYGYSSWRLFMKHDYQLFVMTSMKLYILSGSLQLERVDPYTANENH